MRRRGRRPRSTNCCAIDEFPLGRPPLPPPPPPPPRRRGGGVGRGCRVTFEDPLPLAQALIRCASVTPTDAGAQAVLTDALKQLGFNVTPLRYGSIENLFARIGTGPPHICFAGHTDVVPVG